MTDFTLRFASPGARWLMLFGLTVAYLALGTGNACAGDVHVDKKNNLIVDGKAVFPIYLYHVPRPALEEVDKAGFNTVETPAYGGGVSGVRTFSRDSEYVRDYVNALEQREMYFLYGPGKPLSLFRTVKNSKAHLLNIVEDEPAGGGMDPNAYARKAKKLRRLDPSHPIYLVDWASWRAPSHSKRQLLAKMVPHSDVLAVDIYPIRNSGIHMERIGLAIEHMRQMANGEKPIWYVGQIHELQGDKARRQPTFREVRCMTYLALAHGVKGIGYYHYINVSKTALWERLPRLTEQLRRLAPIMLHGKETEEFTLNAPDRIAARCLVHDGDFYLILANEKKKPALLEFKAGFIKHGSVTTLFNGPPARVTEDGVLHTKLKGYGARAYRLKP